MEKCSLLGHKALGNFSVKNQDEKKLVLLHDPIETKELPLPFQYGGDIAANIVLAASRFLSNGSELKPMTVEVEYLNPGDVSQPRYYHVEKLRETPKTMHTTVRLEQNDNILIAIGSVIFHAHEATSQSLCYHAKFPEDCPLPDELAYDHDLLKKYEQEEKSYVGNDEGEPESKKKREDLKSIFKHDPTSKLHEARRMVYMSHGLGLVAKPVNPECYFKLKKEPTTRLSFWMRYRKEEVDKVFDDFKDDAWSAALLAYASDFRILSPALRWAPDFVSGRMATMTHSMWFSPDFKADGEMKSPTDWILYDVKLIFAGNNTVLCEGQLWNDKKHLLATAKQIGLIRPKSG